MIDENCKLVGERIKWAREQQGYTQAQLGDSLELADAEIQELEQGETPLYLATLGKLCRALDCSLVYLLDLKAEQLTPDEAELLEIYRLLPPGLPRDYVLNYLKSWGKPKPAAWSQSYKAGGEISANRGSETHTGEVL